MKNQYDLVIVGAGVVGTTLALALASLPLRVALVEQVDFKRSSSTPVGAVSKPFALNYASIRLLKTLIPWSVLVDQASPIETVHVSEQGRFGALRIKAHEFGMAALGYVIPSVQLAAVGIQLLLQLSKKPLATGFSLDLLTPAECKAISKTANGWEALVLDSAGTQLKIQTHLLIGADGSDSNIRKLAGIITREQSPEEQLALVATLAPVRSHRQIAYQRFTANGILACLPLLANRVGLVWTGSLPLIQSLQSITEADFMTRLQAVFAGYLGKFTLSSPRAIYPVNSFIAEPQAEPGLILLGNAAHTLLPIAAQGLNLALQDMAVLVDIITATLQAKKKLSSATLGETYLAARLPIQKKWVARTKQLQWLFKQTFTPLTWLRNKGLLAVDLLPPLKKNIVPRLVGIHDRLPNWVRGMAQ